MTVVGGDAEALEATAREFRRAADAMRHHRRALDVLMVRSGWTGPDATHHRHRWESVDSGRLAAVSAFVDELGLALQRHATEQRDAAAPSRPVEPVDATVAGGIVGFGPGDVFDAVDDVVDEVVDRAATMLGGSASAPAAVDPLAVRGRRPATFTTPPTARSAIVTAMEGLADEARIGRDEIEIRSLENGRFVVVLPGVTDLSDGGRELAERLRRVPWDPARAGRDVVASWRDNDEPTVRKMRYAWEAVHRDDTTNNEYAAVTLQALEAAGVPAGAEVMLIGHSFGAYAAVDLAADPSVNLAHGGPSDGYRLRITHVLSAGAETDWRLDELPAATRTLVLNNHFDGVFRAETLLHRDAEPVHDGHLEHEFFGGFDGFGHDESHYIARVATEQQGEVAEWLDEAGARYHAGGVRVSAPVPDPST